MNDVEQPLPPGVQFQAADLEREPLAPAGVARSVLVAGSTGLIGSHLCTALPHRGWTVHKLVRQNPRAASEHYWDPEHGQLETQTIEGIGAVVNLCGAGIGDSRWTAKRKQLLCSSRIDSTALLAKTIASADQPPGVFISASAVGYYGHDADGREFSETSAQGTDFLARLTTDWEAAAAPAISAGVRTVFPRLGMVLTAKGGALSKLLPLFSRGLGGVIGNGKQWVSWISLTDAIRALVWLLEHPDIAGPVNVAAPNPVTNREFTAAIAASINKPALLPVPAFAVKAALGEMGETLAVKGVKAIPERLLSYGFEFKHLKIADALKHELSDGE